MKQMKRLLKEVRYTFKNIILFEKMLDSILVTLLFYVIFRFFNFYYEASLFIGLGYFIMVTAFEFKRRRFYREIEETYPFINEKIRTVADNIDYSNKVIEELHEEVLHDISRVETATFFNAKKASYKVLVIIFICIMIVQMSVFGYRYDLMQKIENMPIYDYIKGGNETGDGTPGDTRSAGGGAAGDIFGQDEVATLGNKEVEVMIKPSGYELDIREIKEPKMRYFEEAFPEDFFAAQEVTYEENIEKDEQELVRNYFSKLT